MTDLEVRLVVATAGAVLAAGGSLAAANFKDLAGRQARWASARWGPPTMWGRESWYHKNQFWSMRIVGALLACLGLILIIAAFAATWTTS